MNIQPTINYNQKKTSFKSAYPVIHWVRETNGSFAPAVSEELNKRLQRAVVKLLNNQGKNISESKIAMRDYVKQVISVSDKDFAQAPVARSFYNGKGGREGKKFEPLGYILTGQHAENMTENLGKPIGRARNYGKSAEFNIAIGDYWRRGLRYVKKLAAQFRDEKNVRSALHTKFEVIRSKTGKIKEFRLLDLKFCPEEGKDNPFVRTGYL